MSTVSLFSTAGVRCLSNVSNNTCSPLAAAQLVSHSKWCSANFKSVDIYPLVLSARSCSTSQLWHSFILHSASFIPSANTTAVFFFPQRYKAGLRSHFSGTVGWPVALNWPASCDLYVIWLCSAGMQWVSWWSWKGVCWKSDVLHYRKKPLMHHLQMKQQLLLNSSCEMFCACAMSWTFSLIIFQASRFSVSSYMWKNITIDFPLHGRVLLWSHWIISTGVLSQTFLVG